jgi:hypothetical protein
MYIRVSPATIDKSRLDEAVAIVREMGLPRIRERPGFHNVYVGADHATGRAVVVSTWDTQAQASFAVSPDLASRLIALGIQPQPPSTYEVTDHL